MTAEVVLLGLTIYFSPYSVRGTVRSQEKGDAWVQKHPQWKDKIEFVVSAARLARLAMVLANSRALPNPPLLSCRSSRTSLEPTPSTRPSRESPSSLTPLLPSTTVSSGRLSSRSTTKADSCTLTDVEDNEKDMLQPAIEGTRQMMQACKKEASVKRVVVTSSFAAVLDMARLPAIGTTYS